MKITRNQRNRSVLHDAVCVECENTFQYVGSHLEMINLVVVTVGGLVCARCERYRAFRAKCPDWPVYKGRFAKGVSK